MIHTTWSFSVPRSYMIILDIVERLETELGNPPYLLAVQDIPSPNDISIGYSFVLTAGFLMSSVALAIA